MRRRFLSSICFSHRLPTAFVFAIVSTLNAGSVSAQQDVSESSVTSDRVVVLASSGERQSVAVKKYVLTDTICVAPQDEIWIVSARHACGESCSTTEFETQRLVSNQWQPSSRSELAICHQSDQDHVTVMIVHGNNTNAQWALTRGMQFYAQMFGQNLCGRPGVRFVVFAWGSQQVLARPRPDYEIKADRAVSLGPSVGALLNELGGTRPVLIGHSLGAQVVLSALTELATDESHDSNGGQHGFQVAVIAPAFAPDFACRNLPLIGCNPLLSGAEVFVNRRDRVLRVAQRLNRKRCNDESIEPSLVELVEQGRLDSSRFHLHDVTHEVSNRHSLANYNQSATIQCRIRQLVAKAAVQRVAQAVEAEPDTELAAEAALSRAKTPEASLGPVNIQR